MRRRLAAPAGPSQPLQTLIPEHVLRLLDGIRCTGNLAHKIQTQLKREEYLALDEVLVAIGGKWNRHMKGHVFAPGVDAAARIGDVVASGSVVDPKANGCFWTQPEIAALVIRAADIRPEHLVLEPEAGIGNLITSMRAHGHDNEVHVCELLPENQAVLVKLPNVKLVGSNFLTYAPDDATWYDRIVMNPPFSGQVDIDHVLHALDWLSPVDGVLVSIMAAGVMFRENSKTQHFMKRLAAPGVQATWHDLPDDAFLASGTRVRTVMLRVELSTAAGPRRTPVARPTPPAPTTLPTASTQAAAPAPTTGLFDFDF